MGVEKLLKRFMKESGIYSIPLIKGVSEFINDYDEVFIPFNTFKWSTTAQGHNFWYIKSMEWMLFLYKNIDNIDNDDKEKFSLDMKHIKESMNELLEYYCDEEIIKDELYKIEQYKQLHDVYDSISLT